MLWKCLDKIGGVAIVLLALGAISNRCDAATINYGSFGPVGGFTFADVIESSGTDPVPLYGPPTPFVTGLDFDPTTFVSTQSGGAGDITDGQLNFTITTNAAGSIATLKLSERGDFSLTGVGTAATQALAGAIIQATITQVNGANVVPFSLVPTNGSVGFNLAANPGIVQPWSLGMTMNIAAQVIAHFGANARATAVEIAIDNQLQTLTQASTQAFIAKKDFRIEISGEVIPEPTSLLLFLCGCAGFAMVTGRRAR